MKEKFTNFLKTAVYAIEYSKEILKDWQLYRREGLVIPSYIRSSKAFGLPIRFRYCIHKGGP